MTHSLALLLTPALLLAPLSALCQDPIVTVCRDDNLLRRIDPLTAQTLASVPMTDPSGRTINGSTGLALHPGTGQLWGILKYSGGVRTLATIDETTGVATIIGSLPDSFAGIAFDAMTTLFGVTGDGASTPSSLWTINQTNAQATLVMALDNSQAGPDGESLAFNAADGKLYRASGLGTPNSDEVLDAIDAATQTATRVTLSGFDYEEMLAMTHYVGGVLLGADLDDELLALTDSGVATAIGTLDHSAKGIAILYPPANAGYFLQYGTTCAGPSAREPLLAFNGSPSPGSTTNVGVVAGAVGATGAVLFGMGPGVLPLGACSIQILPLIPGPALPFTLDAMGKSSSPLPIPTGTPVLNLYMQAAMLEGSTLVLTHGVETHIQ